jgi:hypothetical protein
VAPACRAVTDASAMSRCAPLAETVAPLRSRVAAIYRRRQRCGHGGQQRVQPLDAGVAVTGALLGVAMRLANGLIDVEVGDLVDIIPGHLIFRRTARSKINR